MMFIWDKKERRFVPPHDKTSQVDHHKIRHAELVSASLHYEVRQMPKQVRQDGALPRHAEARSISIQSPLLKFSFTKF